MKESLRYGLAVAGYIALSLVTKKYLTWTWGPTYFVLTLEVLPRTWRRLRSLGRPAPEPDPVAAEPVGASR